MRGGVHRRITKALLGRLRAWLIFVAIMAACTIVGPAIPIAITGERGYGGLGLIIAIPLGQVLYGVLVARVGARLGLAGAILANVTGFFGAYALVDVYRVRLVHDFYGLLDQVAVYALISLACWEGLYWLARARRVPALVEEERR